MGKRELEKKPRLERDWYATRDPAAVAALTPHLWHPTGSPVRYIEPCAGDGSLIDLLACSGPPATCVAAYDIDPQRADIVQKSCLFLTGAGVKDCDLLITNPPYKREMLLPILEHLPRLKPTWLLLPADLMHNIYMSPYIDICSDVVAIGRMWWFENDDRKHVRGVDNYCWYKFDYNHKGFTRFWPR